MPEYDAFGREIGEDPLAALREAAVAQPARPEAVEPARPEAVVPPEPVPERPTFVRPRIRRRGSYATLIVVVAFIGGLGLVAGAGVDRIESGIEDLIAEPEPAPGGLDRASMIREENFAAALGALRGSGLGRPLTLRVAPEQVDVELVAPDGLLTLVRFTHRRELQTLGTRDGARYARTIPYRRIDPAAPERLVRDAREPARRIEYVLLDRSGWRAVFRER